MQNPKELVEAALAKPKTPQKSLHQQALDEAIAVEDKFFLECLEKAAKEAGPDGTVFITKELEEKTFKEVLQREREKFVGEHVHDFGGCGECICGAHRDPARLG